MVCGPALTRLLQEEDETMHSKRILVDAARVALRRAVRTQASRTMPRPEMIRRSNTGPCDDPGTF